MFYFKIGNNAEEAEGYIWKLKNFQILQGVLEVGIWMMVT